MTDPVSDFYTPIPMPGALDEEHLKRVSTTDVDDAQPGEMSQVIDNLEDSVERTIAYARDLWHQLDAVTTYLREDVARRGVLGDGDAWQRWQQVYGAALSALAGPKGDSGFGREQAVLEYQHRDGHKVG